MKQSSLKKMTQTRAPKFGHYVGEFATPGIGHIVASARCDFVFFDMEHSGLSLDTLKSAVRYFEAGGVSVLVRSPCKDYDMIARIADAAPEYLPAHTGPRTPLMPRIIDAVRLRASVGEIADTLESVWGRYQPSL